MNQPELPQQSHEYKEPAHKIWCRARTLIRFGEEVILEGTMMKCTGADYRINAATVIRPSGKSGRCDLDDVELVVREGEGKYRAL